MRLRSLLTSAAVVATMGIGSIAMMAGPASAAPLNHPGNVQCFERQCNQPPKCGIMNDNGRQWQQDSKGCCAETITFDFAASPPVTPGKDGTWLLEVSGPPLHNGEALTHDGGTWTVKDWQSHGNGSLGNGKPYFILVEGGVTLSGSLKDGLQTAWTEQDLCITPPRPCVTDGWNQWKNSEGTWSDSRCTRHDPQPVDCLTGWNDQQQQDNIWIQDNRCNSCDTTGGRGGEKVLSLITSDKNNRCDPQPCTTGGGRDTSSWGQQDSRNCDPQPCGEGIRPLTDVRNSGNCCFSFPAITRGDTLPCFQGSKGGSQGGKDDGKGDGGGTPGGGGKSLS